MCSCFNNYLIINSVHKAPTMSSSQKATKKETSKKSQAQTDGDKLSSIATIMSEVRDLLKTMAENLQGSSENQEKTGKQLEEIQVCLKETVKKVNETENLPNPGLINDTNELTIKNEAYRLRKRILKEWKKNRNQRKGAFEAFTRGKTIAELYNEWINQTDPFIPRKFRHKEINGEQSEETELRKELSIERVKTEIKVLQLRSQKFEKKFSDVDENMFETINRNASGNEAEKLRDIWLSALAFLKQDYW